ncbi:lysozyme inhibitor LprI family protein [Pseudobutyrivibrio sp.]|uniref:lysozyme inhibitor LprI family protein n=1 Tax=Pseudobutyrivibrio sp. TaxID=2014367 RepID=UPI0025E49516|nr:lysozyme inhibitor LprI family protein [Pseudobutyrivibrio sp.]
MARRRKRKNRTISITLIVIAIGLIAGVVSYGIYNKMNENVASNTDSKTESTASRAEEQSSSEDISVDDSNATEDDGDTIDFKFLSGYNYEFSSGVGGWSDDFKIEKDGYFHGCYHDSDMGDTGDDYPGGTYYICEYEGHFADIKKVDEYTYTMKLTDLTVTTEPDEYIEDGIKYIPIAPYALDDADEIQIYLPGKPVDDFSDDLKMWLSIDYQDQQDTLEHLALVNVTDDLGICSYERMSDKEEAQSLYDGAKQSYDAYSEELVNAVTTAEMTEITSAQANAVDGVLNSLWILVKYNTDDATYEKVLAEQRQWIADKEETLDQFSPEVNGSMWAVDYNEEWARLTLDRCEELLNYIQ